MIAYIALAVGVGLAAPDMLHALGYALIGCAFLIGLEPK
jgi:hypothetical protein